MSASTPSALPESVYRQPGFLPFLISRVLAMFAVQILAVVVAWQVYDLTRDPLALAYVGLAQFIPMPVLLMPAGDLIDRYDRKRILILSWGVEAICAAALLWLSLSGGAVVWFYGVLVLYG
ncbi:MAG TPA: MFS transporter, partial [Pseudomonas sp.]|nr:MFS transporter [Pseudomonas sp.]